MDIGETIKLLDEERKKESRLLVDLDDIHTNINEYSKIIEEKIFDIIEEDILNDNGMFADWDIREFISVRVKKYFVRIECFSIEYEPTLSVLKKIEEKLQSKYCSIRTEPDDLIVISFMFR